MFYLSLMSDSFCLFRSHKYHMVLDKSNHIMNYLDVTYTYLYIKHLFLPDGITADSIHCELSDSVQGDCAYLHWTAIHTTSSEVFA